MTRSKICFKCNKELSIDDFYKHPAMGDGYLGKCKTCTKKDVLDHRLLNLDKIRAYDRARASLPHRREHVARISRAWLKEDKRRQASYNAVVRAIKSGRLQKENCYKCGSANSLAHHEDYDFPLVVIWLCQPCHKQRHKEINAMLKSTFPSDAMQH